MILYDQLRKVNRQLKQMKKARAGKSLSPVRRIERVYPPQSRRVVAMTFDDGPSALPPNPNKAGGTLGLTETLMNALDAYGAKGTFDVIGTTAKNYPDKRGKIHTASWGGKRHDHYPDINQDALAGAENQPELIAKLVSGGHEISNHSYRHVLFGKNRAVYGSRETFKDLIEVVEDLEALESCVSRITGKGMKLSRPPHYIDAIRDGYNAYDAYALMGYNYLAASFDGGGWLPSTGNYDQDVENMVAPFERLLSENPDALNGQIIFQKDGCNMSLQTPISDALPKQLAILKRYGYEVITVSELLALSPFEDYGEGMDGFESARALANAGHIVGYKNNTFQPERKVTIGELITMSLSTDYYKMLKATLMEEPKGKRLNPRVYKTSYAKHLEFARSLGYMNRITTVNAASEVTMEFMIDFIGGAAKAVGNQSAYVFDPKAGTYTRAEAAEILASVFFDVKKS